VDLVAPHVVAADLQEQDQRESERDRKIERRDRTPERHQAGGGSAGARHLGAQPVGV
jgi:hypothetical protein